MTDDVSICVELTDRNNKDATPEYPSDRVSVKQLVDKFKGFGSDRSGQIAVDQTAKTPMHNKPLKTERDTIGPDIGRNVKSGSRILRTRVTGTKPVTHDKPTENKMCCKEQESLREDISLQMEYEVQHGCDFIEERLDEVILTFNNPVLVRQEATLIDRMNYIEIGQLLQSLNMNSTASLEEDKQKLKQSLFSGQVIDSLSKRIKDVLNKTVQRYKGLKTNLLGLYSDIITTVENESFKKNMSKEIEMRFPHYEDELQSIRTVLQNMTEEFEIVVCGETSSGKSTFLNVLIGERILPSHHLHTTAGLCRLRNSENRRIELIIEKRIVDKIPLTADSDELRRTLDSINKKLLSDDGDNEPLKAIDIYWPVSSLHESVVLVDTPGIGQRDALTKQVVEFVPTSAGYIFIVDSSHAGGVQDSVIKKLIKAIAVSASKEDHINGLSNAIFVCNKWDMVPTQDREAVMEDTKRTIRKYCGRLGDWQIIKFNGNLELKLLELKANPTNDFKALLESLETLMIKTIETRLRDKYRWVRTFVSELLGLIKMGMNTTEQSKEKVHLEIERAGHELDLAKKELEQCSKVEGLIRKEEKALLQQLEEHLKSADVQRKHFDWSTCAIEINSMEDDGPTLIIARLQDAILEWASADTGPLQEASARITNMCKEMQGEINSRIRNINSLDLGFSLTKSSDQSGTLSGPSEYRSSDEIPNFIAASPIWITVGLVVLAVGLIPGLASILHRVANTKENNIKKMTEMTQAIIGILVSENRLQAFITKFITGRYVKWLAKFKKDTVFKITSTRAWIKRMQTNLCLNKNTLQMFNSLQTKLNHCSNVLQQFENDI